MLVSFQARNSESNATFMQLSRPRTRCAWHAHHLVLHSEAGVYPNIDRLVATGLRYCACLCIIDFHRHSYAWSCVFWIHNAAETASMLNLLAPCSESMGMKTGGADIWLHVLADDKPARGEVPMDVKFL